MLHKTKAKIEDILYMVVNLGERNPYPEEIKKQSEEAMREANLTRDQFRALIHAEITIEVYGNIHDYDPAMIDQFKSNFDKNF